MVTSLDRRGPPPCAYLALIRLGRGQQLGDQADRDGHLTLKFPSEAGTELHSGLYVVTVRDRHTAALVSIDLAVS